VANPIKLPGQIINIQSYGTNVFLLTIQPVKKIPRFLPGQFLHLTIDPFDPQDGFWPESRVFSIASAPSSSTIEIIYSVKGKYTSRMSSELKEGNTVWLKFPYGDFSIESLTKDNQDVVLIAGGTGISPFMSYLRESKLTVCRKTHLIYGIRDEAQLLYKDVLAACLNSSAQFTMDLFVEKLIHNSPIQKANLFGGMITLDHILKYRNLQDPVFFLSGPPSMISFFKKGLQSAGIAINNIKIDEWE
jgi:ferredoxin-NADP reductase